MKKCKVLMRECCDCQKRKPLKTMRCTYNGKHGTSWICPECDAKRTEKEEKNENGH